MKRGLLLGAVLVGASLVPSVAQASPLINTGDVIKVVSQSSTINGGPFGIDGPDSGGAADFMTFCIEMDETVAVNASYYVKIESFADAGGLDNDNTNATAPTLDPLSEQSAFLYARYAAGLLSAFTLYDDSQNARDALQLAIWTLENEAVKVADGSYRRRHVTAAPSAQPVAFSTSPVIGNTAIWSLADHLIAVAQANAQANNFYGVQVMQLWQNSDFTGYKQDMLITVPEGASTLAVLMFGIGAVTASRFRFRRTV